MEAVLALGDQVGDQGAHVPVGAVGRPRPVVVAEGSQQLQGYPAFGVGDGLGLVGVRLG